MNDSDHPILLVEDNPDDVLITKRAWSKGRIKNSLFVVNNGEEALKFLNKEENYTDVPLPCLILLDLKMPKMNGFEVLEVIKADDKLKNIPIIVLTSSNRYEDIDRAYKLGCNSYIIKPVNFEKFTKAITSLQQYWLNICTIPSSSANIRI